MKVKQSIINYLTIQLKQDPHGFYPKTIDVAKQLQFIPGTISGYYKQVADNLQDETYHETLRGEIPHFDLLWEDFVDSKTEKDLSKCQQQILALQFEEKDGVIRERAPKEIAEIISTDVLSFDEVFVQTQQEKITNLFQCYPILKEKYNLPISYRKAYPIKLTENEKTYLRIQLNRDPHGFYPKTKDIVKLLQVTPAVISQYYNQISDKLQNKAYLEAVQKEIPDFDLLWDDFMDSKTRCDLSKRQQQILALQFEKKEDGSIYRRTPKEIARMISTDMLSFDEVFVTEQQKKIKFLFCHHKDLKEKYKTPIPHKKPNTIKITENEKKYLIAQLKRDIHGFYPNQGDIAQQLETSKVAIQRYHHTITNKLQHGAYLEAVQKEIPDFDLLWDDFMDSKTEMDLSKRQRQILKEQFEIKEDGSIHKRTPKEIAAVISTDILSFDEVFVKVQQKRIASLFRRYPMLKEKYNAATPTIKKAPIEQTEKNYLTLQLKQDAHGFYPKTKDIANQLQFSSTMINNYYHKITEKLQNDAYLEAVRKVIPHFDLLWEDFVDSKTEKDLSKRQQQILKEQFEIKEDGSIHRRTPKEIARMISTDILSFDEVYVIAQQKKITTLFQHYPALKEKYKVEPSCPRKVQLTEEDILLLKEKYRFDKVTKRYPSSQEQAKKLGMPVKNLVIQDALLLEKLGQPAVKEQLALAQPDLLEAHYIYHHFTTISKKEGNKENESAFSRLESSIFHDFIALCSDNEKQALALRLGYFDGLIHETEEVAKLCHLSLEDVSHLTRSCLQTGKETLEGLTQKGHQKKKR